MNAALTIAIAVISSGCLSTLIQCIFNRKRQDDADAELLKRTLAALAYSSISNEIERLLTKGFASPDERKTISILFETYKLNGWNGDMDARMKKVYDLCTDKYHADSGKK